MESGAATLPSNIIGFRQQEVWELFVRLGIAGANRGP